MSNLMAWVPLESNPDLINKLMINLGVPKDWQMVDVYGLSPDLLAFVPQPVLAVVLLFPVTDELEQFKEEEEKRMQNSSVEISNNLVFIKQLISNACGTMAILHSIANNLDSINLLDGPLKVYLNSVKNLSPEEAGEFLQRSDIASVHDEIAKEGQTEAPDPTTRINYHYITFVEKEGSLYELDGRKALPIYHSPTSKETFLQDAAEVIKRYMARDPDNIQFTVMALATPFT